MSQSVGGTKSASKIAMRFARRRLQASIQRSRFVAVAIFAMQ